MIRASLLAGLLAIFVLVAAPAFGQEGGDQLEEQGGTSYVPGEVVVAEEGGDYAVRKVEAETLGALEEEAAAITEEQDVLAASPNYAYEPVFVPNDPFVEEQYNLLKIGAQESWEYSRGAEASIGFVDSGYATAHPDLDAKVLGEYDFAEDDPVAQDFGTHGTSVVGVAAAETDNAEGVAAVGFDVGFLMAKGCTDVCLLSDTAPAVSWLADQGVDVINLSFGAERKPPGDPVLGLAVQRAQRSGALVVAAVGNGGTNTDSFYPAAYRGVLGVAATDQENAPATFSNSGPVVDMAAPGVSIISTYNPESPANTTGALYARFSGTSHAAPHVAGAAALVKATRPNLTPGKLADRIRSNATDLGKQGRDNVYGHGLLDAACAAAPSRTECGR